MSCYIECMVWGVHEGTWHDMTWMRGKKSFIKKLQQCETPNGNPLHHSTMTVVQQFVHGNVNHACATSAIHGFLSIVMWN